MKQKFTLILLLMFCSILSFGQNTFINGNKKTSHLKQGIKTGKKRINKHFRLHDVQKEKIFKSAQENKQKLDSLIEEEWDGSKWTLYGKEQYTYNEREQVSLYIYYNMDETKGVWREEYKEETEYTKNGKVLQHSSYEWDETENKMVGEEKEEYQYDTNGNDTLFIEYAWDDENDKWLVKYKEERSFDANDNLTQILGYDWDKGTTKWIFTWKKTYTYNAENKMTQFFEYDWNGTEWVSNNKEEYAYNSNGLKTLTLNYDWSGTDWVNSNKLENTYDKNGNLTHKTKNMWEADPGKWLEVEKQEYTFNTNNSVTLYLSKNWNTLDAQWDIKNKHEYSYDDNGNPVKEVYYELNESKELVKKSKYEYTYDLNNILSDFMTPELEDFMQDYPEKIVNKPNEYKSYEWDETGNDWKIYDKSTYYFTEQSTTNVNEVKKEEFKLYPNPVKESLNFSGNYNTISFELYDMLGRKCMSREVKNNEKINVQNLENGIYLYQLNIDGHTQTGKIIKH